MNDRRKKADPAGQDRGGIPRSNREASYHWPCGQMTASRWVTRAGNWGSEQVTFRWELCRCCQIAGNLGDRFRRCRHEWSVAISGASFDQPDGDGVAGRKLLSTRVERGVEIESWWLGLGSW